MVYKDIGVHLFLEDKHTRTKLPKSESQTCYLKTGKFLNVNCHHFVNSILKVTVLRISSSTFMFGFTLLFVETSCRAEVVQTSQLKEGELRIQTDDPKVIEDQTGSCGENVSFYFVASTKKLTISGTGYMWLTITADQFPWYDYPESIQIVVV